MFHISTDKFGRHIRHKECVSRCDFSLTVDGNYDFEHKRLCNIDSPIDDRDGVNKSYVDQTFEQIRQIPSTTLGQFNIVKDLAYVRNEINSLRIDDSSQKSQIVELSNALKNIQELFKVWSEKVGGLLDLADKFKFKFDLVEHKRAQKENKVDVAVNLLSQRLDDLELQVVGLDKHHE